MDESNKPFCKYNHTWQHTPGYVLRGYETITIVLGYRFCSYCLAKIADIATEAY